MSKEVAVDPYTDFLAGFRFEWVIFGHAKYNEQCYLLFVFHDKFDGVLGF
jgi:hypothetical protein